MIPQLVHGVMVIHQRQENCKDSEGNVYVCQYPVGTAPDTWGYYKIPDNLLERLNKLIDFEGTGK